MKRISFYKLVPLLFLWSSSFFYSFEVYAIGQGIVYHGRILNADGTAVKSSQMQLKIQIRSSGAEDCLFYEEEFSADLSATDGVFSFTIQGGLGTRTDNTGYSLAQVFSNRAAFTFVHGECASGTSYTPLATDLRELKFSFKEASATEWESIAREEIQFAPWALEALQVGGFASENICRIVDNAGAPVSVSPITQTMWTKLLGLLNGSNLSVSNSSAVLELSSTNSGFLMPRMTTAQRDGISTPSTGLQVYNTSTNQLNYFNGTTWQAVGAAGSGLSSLGGQTGNSQSFANDTNVIMSSNSDTHTLGWTGQLAMSRGGTNASLTAVNGGAVYSTASAFAITAAGASGQVLTSNGAAAPTWTTINDSTKVVKSGDTMSGLLVLSADPSAALGAATKQYVDTGLSNKQNTLAFTPLNKAGDTMTGVLNLASNGLVVGTNQFVISGNNVGIGTTTPDSNLHVFGVSHIEKQSNDSYSSTSSSVNYPSGANLIMANSGAFDSNFSGTLLSVKNANNLTQGAYMGVIASSGASSYSPSLVFGYSTGATAYAEKMKLDSNGNLIVGNDPGNGTSTKLYAGGQIAGKSYDAGTSCSLDWSHGNTQTTSCNCSTNLSFSNLRDGGNYTLLITDAGTTQCNISATTTGDDALSGTLTTKWNPTNGVRTSSSYTVYSMTRIGSILLVAWQAFQ